MTADTAGSVLPCGTAVAARPYAALGNRKIAFGRASFAGRPFRFGPLAFARGIGRAARDVAVGGGSSARLAAE